jgi:hypothetical protein
VDLATIPDEEFEEVVESERPPGTTLLRKMNKLHSQKEPVSGVLDPDSILRRHRAGDIVGGFLRVERNIELCDMAVVTELLLRSDDAQMLDRVRRAINFAARLKDALNAAGLGNTTSLRTVK